MMEFVIAIVLLAFFWYAAYRAWTGRFPERKRPRQTVVVSHDRRTAEFYLREFGMFFDKRSRIATRPTELYGYSRDVEFIYVNADNAKPDPDVIKRLRILEAQGATVHWVGYDAENEVW